MTTREYLELSLPSALPDKAGVRESSDVMTPEQYTQAWRKLNRYGHYFDMSVDSKLPQPLVKTKAGKIAKRQPGYDKQTKPYYQAQCSFRGLKTTGTTESLQETLQSRDRQKDLIIYQDLRRLRREADAYETEQQRLRDAHDKAQEQARFQQWWQNPTTSFKDKLLYSPQEALEQELKKPDTSLLKSCCVFEAYLCGLSRPAESLGLTYEMVQGPSELPPGSDFFQRQIIGQATAVHSRAKELKQLAEQEAQEQWGSYNAKVEARNAAKERQRQTFVAEAAEASRLQDWDLTGDWVVQCQELATYRTRSPERLSLKIYKDDYQLDAVCEDDPDSEEEYEEGWEYDNRPVKTPKPKKDCPADQQRPRFCAKFKFGVVKGVMRIYPPHSARADTDWTGIKDNPTFEYHWRGRETGEGQIQIEALEFVQSMTFSEHGTSFEGLFDCPYISGPVRMIGTRKSHGRGQKLSSAYKWSHLNERSHDKESYRRWGGW